MGLQIGKTRESPIPPEKEAGSDEVRQVDWLAVLEGLHEAPAGSDEQREALALLTRLITKLTHKILRKNGWYLQEADQADVYQNTVERIFEKYKIDKIRENPGEFVRYTETIIKNLIIDIFRKYQKASQTDYRVNDDLPDHGDGRSPEERLIASVDVAKALETLSQKEKDSIKTVDLNGEKNIEAAHLMGLSERRLKYILKKGRDKLRQYFKKEKEDYSSKKKR